MKSIGITELLVVGAVFAICATPVAAGIVVLVVTLTRRGKRGRPVAEPQFGGQDEAI